MACRALHRPSLPPAAQLRACALVLPAVPSWSRPSAAAACATSALAPPPLSPSPPACWPTTPASAAPPPSAWAGRPRQSWAALCSSSGGAAPLHTLHCICHATSPFIYRRRRRDASAPRLALPGGWAGGSASFGIVGSGGCKYYKCTSRSLKLGLVTMSQAGKKMQAGHKRAAHKAGGSPWCLWQPLPPTPTETQGMRSARAGLKNEQAQPPGIPGGTVLGGGQFALHTTVESVKRELGAVGVGMWLQNELMASCMLGGSRGHAHTLRPPPIPLHALPGHRAAHLYRAGGKAASHIR